MHAGGLGKLEYARGLCYKPRGSIGNVKGPQKVPAHIDYDLWVGPAPMEPLMRKRLHYDWHWVWPTGCGDLGNQGIHQMDLARWALGENALPPRVMSFGGRIGYVDDGTTPNTQLVVCGYEKAPLYFEVRGLPKKKGAKGMDNLHGASIGVIVQGEKGRMVMDSYSSAKVYSPDGELVKKFSGGADHFANFIAAMRSRKVSDLSSDIVEGHLSSALCHLGNASYLTGAELPWSTTLANEATDSGVAETKARLLAHLRSNEINPDEAMMRVGPTLEIDPKTERFTNFERANTLLSRTPRRPFVVPDVV